MKLQFIAGFLLIIISSPFVYSQAETYTVTKTNFSKDNFQEFCPVYYKDKIVFCTDRNKSLSNYSSAGDARFFNIYYADTIQSAKSTQAKPFSKELNSKLNDGPVTFNRTGDTIFYSRNLMVEGKLNDLSADQNKLGIFYAVFDNKKWSKVSDFRYNSEWYNLSTPCLSPDGKRLYFASDSPDSYGGSDIFYSEWKDGFWDNPVNLGPVINTEGNEAYPFINPSGELYFSSDGHPGMGGKDIFFSKPDGKSWLPPVALDAPINSSHDDFGITTDSAMNEGYFSSNRGKTFDIYHFKTNFPQIFYTNLQREHQYCFQFSYPGSIRIDTTDLKYVWSFGDGEQESGDTVSHCFPDNGDFKVRLDVVDRSTGKLFFTELEYTLEIQDFEQAYIQATDVAVAGEEVKFDGLSSYLPGNQVINYAWDFGDGTRITGEEVSHVFANAGEYFVHLGLTLKSDSGGIINKTAVSRKIKITNNSLEKEYYMAQQAAEKSPVPSIQNAKNVIIKNLYVGEPEVLKETEFRIELATSRNKLSLSNSKFRRLPAKYTLQEYFNPKDSIYSYNVEHQMSLMACYPSFSELYKLGFTDARVRTFLLLDPAEKELFNLIKIYGASADSYFDNYERLTTNAYIMLDQVVKLMIKYPKLKLEIAVHSDNSGLATSNLALSQRRAETMVNYLINREISGSRLTAIGFGESKPIASNLTREDRKLNRRIDFIITSN